MAWTLQCHCRRPSLSLVSSFSALTTKKKKQIRRQDFFIDSGTSCTLTSDFSSVQSSPPPLLLNKPNFISPSKSSSSSSLARSSLHFTSPHWLTRHHRSIVIVTSSPLSFPLHHPHQVLMIITFLLQRLSINSRQICLCVCLAGGQIYLPLLLLLSSSIFFSCCTNIVLPLFFPFLFLHNKWTVP